MRGRYATKPPRLYTSAPPDCDPRVGHLLEMSNSPSGCGRGSVSQCASTVPGGLGASRATGSSPSTGSPLRLGAALFVLILTRSRRGLGSAPLLAPLLTLPLTLPLPPPLALSFPSGSPYMSMTVQAKEDVKETIPAVLHIDGSARLQTVGTLAAPLYRALIRLFFALTGVRRATLSAHHRHHRSPPSPPTTASSCS